MKCAALIVQLVDGTLASEASEFVDAAVERARQIRVAGTFNDAPVARGLVIAPHRFGPIYRFSCDNQPAEAAPAVDPEEGNQQPANARARKK